MYTCDHNHALGASSDALPAAREAGRSRGAMIAAEQNE